MLEELKDTSSAESGRVRDTSLLYFGLLSFCTEYHRSSKTQALGNVY
jgi:hypothetical protein